VLNYKKPSFWIVSVAVVVVIVASVYLLTNPQSISLPDVDVVQSIEMEQFNEGSSLGIVTITDREDIDIVLSNLSGAKKTMRISTNDYPTQNNYLVVRLTLEKERRTLCLYSDGGSYYVEEPYVGVYKSNRDASVAIYKVYTVTLEPTSPEWSPEQIVGVDMAELDFASDDIVIFHDYFGLFVYNLNSLKIIRSLDLKPLNCHQTQGDNYCDVSVSMDGNTVQLHPMSSKNMYVYKVSSHILQETIYKPMADSFRSQFVPIEEVIDSTILGNYSHNAVRFGTGEYGYLHTYDGTLGTLSYVRGDMMFSLFDINE